MTLSTTMLSDLLKKYEKSKHLKSPNSSNRRVTLSKEKGELRGYQWENLKSATLFAQEAKRLEGEGLVTIHWEIQEKVLGLVVLNLDRVAEAYAFLGQRPPWQQADEAVALLRQQLEPLQSPWLKAWRDGLCGEITQSWKLPPFFKKGEDYVKNLCALFRVYDQFPKEGRTLRSFSIQALHNSKTLEQHYQEDFLKVCKDHHPELSQLLLVSQLSQKEMLLFLGITPRGELFEFSGNITLTTEGGKVSVGALGRHGIALPALGCGEILQIDFHGITEVYFLENKTNYDAFVNRRKDHQLVFYHGGFFSPSKGVFFQKVRKFIPEIPVYFWGDIDLGGFLMFGRLQEIFPSLQPYQMGAKEVLRYQAQGLRRPDSYLKKVTLALEERKFPLFAEAMVEILRFGVTMEQEVFLGE